MTNTTQTPDTFTVVSSPAAEQPMTLAQAKAYHANAAQLVTDLQEKLAAQPSMRFSAMLEQHIVQAACAEAVAECWRIAVKEESLLSAALHAATELSSALVCGTQSLTGLARVRGKRRFLAQVEIHLSPNSKAQIYSTII